jgi:hypothetical protein
MTFAMASTAWHGAAGRSTGERVAEHPAVRTTARIGLAARGVLYLLVGLLALRVALGNGSDRADKSGAIATVARQPFGKGLLVALAVGFAAYAAWMIVRAVVVEERRDRKRRTKRAAYVGRAAVYGVLSASCLQALSQSQAATENNSTRQAHELTATVMGWSFGRPLVALAGVALIAAMFVFVDRGMTQKWRDDLDLSPLRHSTRQAVRMSARIGWVGRGLVFGLVGIFVVRAALQFDPNDAVGLDGSLRELANGTGGRALLALAAFGLLAFGCYSLVEAKYRRVDER